MSKTYKNINTGTTFTNNGHNTIIKKVGESRKIVETQWANRNKNL
ncbi:hypothetical protein GCM10011531_07010 [Aquaticitalea lipolytica]|uniref:Uncharacterized protein n=1 Tax=Aquaticitalea lipolytica TaxID=1247562 RepID=A0A8J2TT41_9FLAO|nr:hypothetical protein [Aquaticitalea lipolytica]GFZ79698.1 hypothetical protein GCM10011531_07010 [Aquaticitalea lipolytica]